MDWVYTSLKKGMEYLTLFVGITGVLWYFGEPRAQEYIQGTVEGRIGAVEKKITDEAGKLSDTVEGIAKTVEEQLEIETEKDNQAAKEVEERLTKGELSDIRQESDLNTVKSDLDEIKDAQKVLNEDIKTLLRELIP